MTYCFSLMSDDVIGDAVVHGFLATEPVIPLLAATVEKTPEAEHARLLNDRQYLLYYLERMLGAARIEFQQKRYDEAAKLYNQYFRYENFYGIGEYYGITKAYFDALYEYTWVMEIQGRHQEVQAFFNKELLDMLNPALQSTRPEDRVLKETIESLQHQQMLPIEQNLRVQVSLETFGRLSELFNQQGHPQAAIQILKFAEAETMWAALTLRNMLSKYDASIQKPTEPRNPFSVLASAYQHFGVPVAPVLPVTPEAMKNIHGHRPVEPEYDIQRVNPIAALGKDPRQRQERNRRQRTLANAKRKGVPRRQKPSPPITF